MVDTISSAKGIRHAGSPRYGASPASSPAFDRPVTPATATDGADRHEQGGGEHETPHDDAQDNQDLRLEIAEDEGGKELVYRFVDAQTGDVVREWNADEFGKLRDYVRHKKIHLLDKKI